jgi:uncharacterized damage-inducible protein DinB
LRGPGLCWLRAFPTQAPKAVTGSKLPEERMPTRTKPSASGAHEILLETFAANGRMNELLLENLDPRAWRAASPKAKGGEGRTIAAIFAHMHNNRLRWIERSAPHLKCPKPIDPERCTIAQARAAHKRSAASCLAMLKDVLATDPKAPHKIKIFSRGSWAPNWPAGPTMFAYMFAHDAHHRGQVTMLAHQLGYKLPDDAAYGIWRWDQLWKDCGFTARPR